MLAIRRLLTTFGVITLLCSPTVGAEPQPLDFDQCSWIWSPPPPGFAGAQPDTEVRFFRSAVQLPADVKPTSAELIVTADNLYTVYLNGGSVGESSNNPNHWNRPRRFDVSSLIRPGRNVVAIEAVNTASGPAGLLAKLVVRVDGGQEFVLGTDDRWRCGNHEQPNWHAVGFDDSKWATVKVVTAYGGRPWGKVVVPAQSQPRMAKVGQIRQLSRQILAVRKRWTQARVQSAPDNFTWPGAVVFVGDDCSLYRQPKGKEPSAWDSLTVTIFNPRNSRAFPEHDLPGPMKVGRKLFLLQPARPDAKPRLLFDAGEGALGSPSVTFDGKSVLFSMVRPQESFFHIYRLTVSSGELQQLTKGPFHDIDPAELPDGRIVFTSTRIGTFEEYHSPPSRSLFTIENASDGKPQPLTYTIIFDNEPEVLPDGRILFIRSDNFFDRGKVETTLHAIHPDGTSGLTSFGVDNGPEYGGRLRAFDCGSPAPMPDGHVAYVSKRGITLGNVGHPEDDLQCIEVAAGDVAALPDNRLLCTLAGAGGLYDKIAVLDPRASPPGLTVCYESKSGALHSPVALIPRRRPPVLTDKSAEAGEHAAQSTGFLYCQNARVTTNTTAGWPHVRAIRVLAAKGLTTRSSHSYIVHAGSEVIELGTVPLASDGSFFVEVPADTPLALQAVDAEGRSELNEMSWIYVRPGEHRSCVGCHQGRSLAPPAHQMQAHALSIPPLQLLGSGQPHRFRGNNAAVTGLMELQFDRFREVAGLSRHAETADPTATGSSEVAALVAQLQSADDGLVTSSLQRLALFRERSSATEIARCLSHDSRETRVAAAVALAACGTRESVEPLLATLADPDPLVAQAAALALENLTGYAPPFDSFAAFQTKCEQRQAWAKWFADKTWNEIEQSLIQQMASDDKDVVRRTAVALGHIGGEAACNALRKYVVENRDDNPYPAWRKTHQGDGTRFNSLSDANPRTLQEVVRALGHLQDQEAIPLLAETLKQHAQPETGNLFLAEAAVEALGRLQGPTAEAALIDCFEQLGDYPQYSRWYGDHTALIACHASPVHYLIAEALDRTGSVQAKRIVPHLIRSLPTDPDRALFLPNDDCETLIGRVIRRQELEPTVVETCLALLGDEQAVADADVKAALSQVSGCWGGTPTPEIRAAQVLSLVCRTRSYQPRILAALQRFRQTETEIPRVFDTGIPVVDRMPTKHWVCFYLARSLGNLRDVRSVLPLVAILEEEPAEAAGGRPDPLGPGIHFLHNDLTPCWRAAVAWALGQHGNRQAVPVLLEIVSDLENATDTRHAAATALQQIADPTSFRRIEQLAADYPEISTRRVLLSIGKQRSGLQQGGVASAP